jgi:Na+/citrate or Na+/malate symporter
MTPQLEVGVIIILVTVVLAFGSGVAVGLLIGIRKKDRPPTDHD